MIVESIAKLVEGQSLTQQEAAATMEDIMEDRATPAQFGAFVTALRIKGETADEIAGMAEVMRRKALRVSTTMPVVDTCGTGGDGSGSFNVSTAAAFVVAATGQAVAKHGNRGMSSACGSADVLEALGARIDLGPDEVARCIDETGFGFMFAQRYHPAMKFASPLRREIGIRTVFNILGPLTNPAGARTQVLGAPNGVAQARLAGALARLGVERALVVNGLEGLDEISIAGPSRILDVSASGVDEYEVHPEHFGLPAAGHDAVKGGDATRNAAIIRGILGGHATEAEAAQRHIVALNAAAALVAAGRAADLAEGVRVATQVIDSGEALARVEAFVRMTQSFAN